jgi:phage shock protein C
MIGRESNQQLQQEITMEKKMYRSRTNRVFGGVCAGIGCYLGIDPTIVRLIFIALFLTFGVGPLVYLILWIIMPLEPGIPGVLDVTPLDAIPEDQPEDVE